MTRLEGPEQARRVARYWSEEGVDWFKAYTWISRAELGAAIEEAHYKTLVIRDGLADGEHGVSPADGRGLEPGPEATHQGATLGCSDVGVQLARVVGEARASAISKTVQGVPT